MMLKSQLQARRGECEYVDEKDVLAQFELVNWKNRENYPQLMNSKIT